MGDFTAVRKYKLNKSLPLLRVMVFSVYRLFSFFLVKDKVGRAKVMNIYFKKILKIKNSLWPDSIKKERLKSVQTFSFNTTLWKITPALQHLSEQTPCFRPGKDLVLCILPFECGKTPWGKKKC